MTLSMRNGDLATLDYILELADTTFTGRLVSTSLDNNYGLYYPYIRYPDDVSTFDRYKVEYHKQRGRDIMDGFELTLEDCRILAQLLYDGAILQISIYGHSSLLLTKDDIDICESIDHAANDFYGMIGRHACSLNITFAYYELPGYKGG